MKKRLYAFALTLLMLVTVFTLSSCFQKETAYELITGAVEKTSALDAMDATVEANMNLEMMGIEMPIPMSYNVKATGLQSDSPIQYTEIDMSLMGVGMTTIAYTEGDYCYIVDNDPATGETVQMKVANGAYAEEFDVLQDITSMIQPFSEEVLADKEIVRNDDGSKTVAFDMNPDDFNAVFGNLVALVSENVGGEVSDVMDTMDGGFSDMKAEITVGEDGYIHVYKISFTMNVSVEAEGVTVDAVCTTDMSATYHNPGQEVTITPPEGYETFTEYYMEESAYDFVTGAMEKNAALDSMDAGMDININLSMLGMDFSLPMNYDIKAMGLQGNYPVYLTESSMSAFGAESKSTAYFEGDSCYVVISDSTTGADYCYKLPVGEYTTEYDTLVAIEGFMLPYAETEGLLANQLIIQNEDGTRTVAFEMSEELFNEAYGEIADSLLSSFAESFGSSELNFSNMNAEIVVTADGYIQTSRLSFAMIMALDVEGLSMDSTCAVDIIIAYNNPGEVVTVTPPEGYLDFEELTEEDLEG